MYDAERCETPEMRDLSDRRMALEAQRDSARNLLSLKLLQRSVSTDYVPIADAEAAVTRAQSDLAATEDDLDRVRVRHCSRCPDSLECPHNMAHPGGSRAAYWEWATREQQRRDREDAVDELADEMAAAQEQLDALADELGHALADVYQSGLIDP